MSIRTWTHASTGYLEWRGSGVRPFGGDAGRSVQPLAPARGSGLPVSGVVAAEALIDIPMGTAAPFGIHTTVTVTRVNGTTLGIPSFRRPLS